MGSMNGKKNGKPHIVVYPWKEFLQGLLQKGLTMSISLKVWGIVLSFFALFWGAMCSLVIILTHKGETLSPEVMLDMLTRQGLISAGVLATIWGTIYGVREIFKVRNLDTMRNGKAVSGDKNPDGPTEYDFGAAPPVTAHSVSPQAPGATQPITTDEEEGA